MSKRVNAIQEVKESVALLTQLLEDYDRTATNQGNADLIQVKEKNSWFEVVGARVGSLPHAQPQLDLAECKCIFPRRQDLYQRCEKMRPTLFRLASDTEDNDEALGEQRAFFISY